MAPITVISLLTRRQDLTTADFQKYWREIHGPLGAKIPGLVGYVQNHVIDSRQIAIRFDRGSWNVDGFVELEFKDQDSFAEAQRSQELAAARLDEAAFIGAITIMKCERRVIISRRANEPPVKRMSILARKAASSQAAFRREWLDVHPNYVSAIHDLAGYNQNVVVSQDPHPTSSSAGIDGIAEMWFPDIGTIDRAFASSAGKDAQRHADVFLQTITTFLVEPYRLV